MRFSTMLQTAPAWLNSEDPAELEHIVNKALSEGLTEAGLEGLGGPTSSQ